MKILIIFFIQVGIVICSHQHRISLSLETNRQSNHGKSHHNSIFGGIKNHFQRKKEFITGLKLFPGRYHGHHFVFNEETDQLIENKQGLIPSLGSCAPPKKQAGNINIVKCSTSAHLCLLICKQGYIFPNGETSLIINCMDQEWIVKDSEWPEIPSCAPTCLPFCENNGICISPGHCKCPESFHGDHCQHKKQLCLSKPPLAKNSNVTCDSESCRIVCAKGYKFPDGTSNTNLNCLDGQWVPSRPELTRIPDCEPTCEPPCQNGGSCLSFNVCQCFNRFRGSQCQYDTEICSPKKMNFNGSYNCSGGSEQITCQLSCPSSVTFTFTPAKEYTCEYSKGYFTPTNIPKCSIQTNLFQREETSLTNINEAFIYERGDQSESLPGDEDDYDWEEIILKTILKVKTKNINKIPNFSFGGLNSILRAPQTYILISRKELLTSIPETAHCSTWGGKNVKTFDGLLYRGFFHCAHTLVQDNLEGLFHIVLESCPHTNEISCPYKLHIFLKNIMYTFQIEDGKIVFKTPKKSLAMPVQVMGMKVSPDGQFLKIDLESIGLILHWDLQNFISIEASSGLWNRTSGLCGSMDKNVYNDFMSKDRFLLKTPQSFIDAWKVPLINSIAKCLMEDKSEFEINRECDENMEKNATVLCQKLLSDQKLQKCFKVFDKLVLTELCINEYCNCKNELNPFSCNCEGLSVLTKECKLKGVDLVQGWRNLEICPMNCRKGQIYKVCGPSITPTCGSASLDILTVCKEGCFCPDGTVQHMDECIPIELCPCYLRNKQFNPGSKIKKNCNTCTCENGAWTCTDMKCGARCGIVGDQHLVTFDGKRYKFMGKCSYYILQTPNVSVEAENIACGGEISEAMNLENSIFSDMQSCIKSITVNLKDITLKLTHGRSIFVNGKEINKFPKSINSRQIIIRQASSTMISVNFDDGLYILWDGFSQIFIDVPTKYRGQTQGLCGTFNSNTQDDFLTPEGDIDTNVEAFTDKWQTKDSCITSNIFKTAPHPCEVNPENKKKAEHYCAKILDDVFENCHWSVDPEPFYEDCMHDVCSCKNDASTCFCPILGAYGMECSRQGINTNWRLSVEECALDCPRGQIYDECGDSCTRFCGDIQSKDICEGNCVDGCRCPSGQYLNDLNECIPANLCPCIYDGLSFEVGYKEVRPGTQYLEICTCLGGVWNCEEAKPGDKDLYPPASEVHNKCLNKSFEEFTKCLPTEPKTCKNMDNYVETFEDCHPGCICQAGYILDTSLQRCVLPENCACHHGGKNYNDSDEITANCNKCKCKSGTWECTNNVCPGTCTVSGDSHFTTFDGKDFDFQGACDYVLAKGMHDDGTGFSVTIQNIICGSFGVTCSKSVKILLNGDVTDSITLSSDFKDIKPFERNESSDRKTKNDYLIYKVGLFTVIETVSIGIQVKWDHGTRVIVKLTDIWRNKVSGLCGNYNGDTQDDMKTPSLGVETSPILFGHAWKLEDYCQIPTEQIDACKKHPERKAWAEFKCNILNSVEFKNCHSEVPVESYYKRCVFDTCACDQGGDCECLCTSLAAYAYECASKGIALKWRKPDLCPLQCDGNLSSYSECVPACPEESCESYLDHRDSQRMCLTEPCSEGCTVNACQEGYIYLNSSYKECVPKAECAPICMEKDGIVFYEGDILSQDDCHTCRCSRKKQICSGIPCTNNKISSTPGLPSLTQELECIDGWTEWINQDYISKDKLQNNGYTFKEADIEPIPNLFELQPLLSVGSCPKNLMTMIECRVVETHENSSVTDDDTICDLSKGLICVGKCRDYEIRMFCECKQESTTSAPSISVTPHITTSFSVSNEVATTLPNFYSCNSSVQYVEATEDCHKFFQCTPSSDGSWKYVEKTCGPSMMFNPVSLTCDWIFSVELIKPKCRKSQKFVLNTTISPNICDPLKPYQRIPGKCYNYMECQKDKDGYWMPIEKSCGSGMMFNIEKNICDWIVNVLIIRPDCTVSNTSNGIKNQNVCPPGEIMSNCVIPCGQSCHYYHHELFETNLCAPYEDECKSGCTKFNKSLDCPFGKLWQDEKICVDIADCPCMSRKGKRIKPNDMLMESDCELCQCIHNEYICSSNDCEKSTTEAINATSSESIEYTTEETIIIPSTQSPPLLCDSARLVPMISNGDQKLLPDEAITASSILGSSFLPKFSRLNSKPSGFSSGSWSPKINDQNQYLQVVFPRSTPLYGVIIQGSPMFDQYVTKFKILHSWDGEAFHYLVDDSGVPQIFSGGIDSRKAVRSMFKIPIEAKTIRIYPLKWHRGISIRVEILGCKLEQTTVPPTPPSVYTTPLAYETIRAIETTTEQVNVIDDIIDAICDDPMGIENGKILPTQVSASSISTGQLFSNLNLIDTLKLSSDEGWRPAISSQNEYISIDFLEIKNLTGIKTKGGSKGWVTAYKVMYSKNGNIWNKIMSFNGLPKVFLGNSDELTANTNYFKYPVQAQHLKVIPIKWHSTIEMKIEPIGCFQQLYDNEIEEVAVTFTSIKRPNKICPVCQNIEQLFENSFNFCNCSEPLFWNGEKCVDRYLCPCIVGYQMYEIGVKYENENCEECVCVLGGTPKCEPQKCPKCKDGLRLAKPTTCSCTCEECPEFQRLCPSSGDCIPESFWCNGIEDCEDDEVNCEENIISPPKQTTITETINVTKACPDPYCPPGMEMQAVSFKESTKQSAIFDLDSKIYNKHNKFKFNHEVLTLLKKLNDIFPDVKKNNDSTKTDHCFQYICAPLQVPIIFENHTKVVTCPQPECPENYDVDIDKTNSKTNNDCPNYFCIPKPKNDAVCIINGRSIKTFDGTEFKYDICSHILARNFNKNNWLVILNKTCSSGNYICQKELIIIDKDANYEMTLQPDLNVILNGVLYSVQQLEHSPFAQSEFIISKPGNTILVVMRPHGFWVSYDENGIIKLGSSVKNLNNIDGLCGYYNDIPADDKTLSNGKLAHITEEFGDSWFTANISKSFCKPQACSKQNQAEALQICNKIKDEIFKSCNKVNYNKFISLCMESACECLSSSEYTPEKLKSQCKCNILEIFVKECLTINPNAQIDTWRAVYGCEVFCPPPLEYKDCFRRRCERSCENLYTTECPVLPDQCFSGCFCPSGTVRKGDNCIPIIECKDCICDGFGKSKYITYDRQNLTFNGNCTYLLSRDISIPGTYTFQVYVSLDHCNKGQLKETSLSIGNKTSCTKALHIFNREHIIHVQQYGKTQKIFIDGIEPKKLPILFSWLKVKEIQNGQLLISLLTSQVDISSSLNELSFSIRVPSIKYGKKMEGLCGNCDGNPNNDLKMNPRILNTKLDNTLKDVIMSWQADEQNLGSNNDSKCNTEVDINRDCMLPPPEQDPCMVLLDQKKFGKCHLIVDPIMYISECQQDMCKQGADQKLICESLEAYARECTRKGVCLEWRKSTFCQMNCPPHLEYKACGCVETCESLKEKQIFSVTNIYTNAIIKGKKDDNSCRQAIGEGCFCPAGKIFENGKCIPEKYCQKCDEEEHHPGDSWSIDKCTKCVCSLTGKVTCSKQECSISDKVCEKDYHLIETQSEECCPKFKCVAIPKSKSPEKCPDAPLPICGPGQINKLFNRSDGCPQYICECKPKSECEELEENIILRPGEYIVQDTSGCCPIQRIQCDIFKCPLKPLSCEQKFYEVIEEKNLTDCCTTFKCLPPKNSCIVNINGEDIIKMVGSRWLDKSNPCIQKICTYGPEGDLRIVEEIEKCEAINCKRGYKYITKAEKCCGKCVESLCKYGDELYEPGEVWYSNNNCTTHKCVLKNEQIFIVSNDTICPNISECVKASALQKSCCSICNKPTESLKNCLTIPLADSETVGLLKVVHPLYGMCQNFGPIKGITECYGSCESGSHFNQTTFGQDKSCQCCYVEKYKSLEVTLRCKNGSSLQKSINVPSTCSCQLCSELEPFPKHLKNKKNYIQGFL